MAAGKYELAVCAIFQDDAPYLREWIEFHKIQGVEHFFLYNNCSADHCSAVLAPYVKSGEATLIYWPHKHGHADGLSWNTIQCGAYMHCLRYFGSQTDWLACIDSDEFLFCPSGERLTSFLQRYTNYGGVTANWRMFGSSEIFDIPPKSLMIELLTRCSPPDYGPNIHVKSIVQPKYTVYCHTPHSFQYAADKFAVEPDYTPISGALSSSIKLDMLRINHYWTRTERYLHEDKIPRRNHMYGEGSEGILKMGRELNLEQDDAILQFVPKLRQNMGF